MLVFAFAGCPVATNHGFLVTYEYWPMRLSAPYFASFQKLLLKPKLPSCMDRLWPDDGDGHPVTVEGEKPQPTKHPLVSVCTFREMYTKP